MTVKNTRPTAVVYFIVCHSQDAVKIGYTKNITKRILQLQTSQPEPLMLLGTVPGTVILERKLHYLLRHYHIYLEWFRCEPEVENFLRYYSETKDFVKAMTSYGDQLKKFHCSRSVKAFKEKTKKTKIQPLLRIKTQHSNNHKKDIERNLKSIERANRAMGRIPKSELLAVCTAQRHRDIQLRDVEKTIRTFGLSRSEGKAVIAKLKKDGDLLK